MMDTKQLALLQDATIKKSIIYAPIDSLKLSRYNPRYSRDDEAIGRLAQRIGQNGFEITRALWATKNGTGYDVFAGGTRLEAARRAGCTEVPIVLHEGLTDDEIVRLADQDNENDEYHERVSITDAWANYAWLNEKEGWTQERIAGVKGVNKSLVSERIKWNRLPDTIKKYVLTEELVEGHIREISSLVLTLELSPWLDTVRVQLELCKVASKDKLTVRQTKELVEKYKGLIELTNECYTKLDKWQSEFEAKHDVKWAKYCIRFVKRLAETEARTKTAINEAFALERDTYRVDIAGYEARLKQLHSEAERERARIDAERARTQYIESILSRIYLGDFYEVCQRLEPDSVDVILTDPPYPAEYAPLYGKLAEVAARILKPGGFLLAMSGQSYLPDIMQLMMPHLNYHWVISYQTPGGQSPQIWNRNINTFWKPVLWFVKGEYSGEQWFGDVVSSDANDKRYHEWGQSESGIGRLMEKYTQPDDLILDPFFGGGTVGVVALRLGRRFIGIDNDGEQVKISKERIFEELQGASNG